MKQFKNLFIAVVMLFIAISLTACNLKGTSDDTGKNEDTINNGNENQGNEDNKNETPNGSDETNIPNEDNKNETPEQPDKNEAKILIVYFSCTNTTKGRAEALQAKLDADIYEIVPEVPYTSSDLNYNNSSCRANQEQRDANSRPEIKGRVENISQYDVIYIGYPIWWSQAPRIIYTFLESYDFDGITLIPFCTSGGSGMGTSGTNLHSSAPNAIWKSGCLVRSASDIDTLVNMK